MRLKNKQKNRVRNFNHRRVMIFFEIFCELILNKSPYVRDFKISKKNRVRNLNHHRVMFFVSFFVKSF